jgi:membrane protein required for colicin V production
MGFLDIVLVIPILFGAYMGFRKGLIIEVCSLIALGAGVYLGLKFSDLVAGWINSLMSEPSRYVNLIAFSIVFIAVVVLVFFLGKILERGINLAMLKPINKIFGAVFGLAKMVLFTGVILVIVDAYMKEADPFTKEEKKNSLLYEPLSSIATEAIPAFYSSEF